MIIIRIIPHLWVILDPMHQQPGHCPLSTDTATAAGLAPTAASGAVPMQCPARTNEVHFNDGPSEVSRAQNTRQIGRVTPFPKLRFCLQNAAGKLWRRALLKSKHHLLPWDCNPNEPIPGPSRDTVCSPGMRVIVRPQFD